MINDVKCYWKLRMGENNRKRRQIELKNINIVAIYRLNIYKDNK